MHCYFVDRYNIMHIQDHYMDLLIFACIFDQLRNDDVVLVDKTNFRFRATLPPFLALQLVLKSNARIYVRINRWK